MKSAAKEKMPVILLLILFFILVITSVNTKSPVCDAAAHHIGSAYSYVKTGDFRMNPSAPPLLRLLMGLPLLCLDLKLPLDHPSWITINSTEFHYQFLFVYNQIADKIVFLSRLPMIILSVLLGLLIFIWSRILYGYKAGLFALFLYVFSPTILANAGLAMLDMGCAFFIFLAMFQLWRYLKDKSQFNLLLTGVCFGLAQSTKITAVILYPLFIIFMLSAIILNRQQQRLTVHKAITDIALIWSIGILVLWATYFFEFKPLLKNAPDVEEKIGYIKMFSSLLPFINSDRFSGFLINFAKNVPIPLSTYIVTLLGVVHIAMSDYPLYFMGDIIPGGSRIYYIVNYAIKTPIPVLLMIALSIILVRKRTELNLFTTLFIIVPILTSFVISSLSKLQGGLRYLLPMEPFLLVWISDIINIDLKKYTKGLKTGIFLLCGWYVVSSTLCYPHYLAYFNELVGGPGGFGYKITADMDWGQDFKALKKYLDKKGIKKVKLHCFGTVEPGYYGIKYERLTDEEFKRPIPGNYYAISSRFLSDVKWSDDYTPIDRVAYTVFIYYIKK